MKKKNVIMSILLIVCLLIPLGVQARATNTDVLSTNTIQISQSDVDAIQNDVQLNDTDKIKKLVTLLFDLKADGFRLEKRQNFDMFMDPDKKFSKNLKYFADKSYLDIETKKQTGLKFLWDKNSINFTDVKVNVTNATVLAYVSHNFQAADITDPSFAGTEYTIELNKLNNKWIITKITSNDPFDQAYSESGMSVDQMLKPNKKVVEETADSVKAKKESMKTKIAALVAIGFVDNQYNRENAAKYAKTYASYATRNQNYIYYNNADQTDCQNFASQCVWAGFGGVATDSYSIENKLFPMCNQGSAGARSWYQTKSGSTPTNWSWTGCIQFKNYLAAGGYAVGPYGYEFNEVAYSNLGDVIEIQWAGGTKRHSMVVTSFTSGSVYGSRTRSQINVSAHSNDHNNYPLTSIAGTNDTVYTESIGGNLQ